MDTMTNQVACGTFSPYGTQVHVTWVHVGPLTYVSDVNDASPILPLAIPPRYMAPECKFNAPV